MVSSSGSYPGHRCRSFILRLLSRVPPLVRALPGAEVVSVMLLPNLTFPNPILADFALHKVWGAGMAVLATPFLDWPYPGRLGSLAFFFLQHRLQEV